MSLTNDDTTPTHAIYDEGGLMTEEAVFTIRVRSDSPALIDWVAQHLKAAMDTVWDMADPSDIFPGQGDPDATLDRELERTFVVLTDDDKVVIAEA